VTTGSNIPKPLDGVRVLDLTSVIMGPFATQCLGDLGAEVITVETARISPNRLMTAGPHSQLSGVALNLLRNKRSIILDLKHRRGRDIALDLAATCEVFVTNLRPGPLTRLGLDYEAVQSRRADVVYCQAQGYPSTGPLADEPAYDDVIQAATGVADLGGKVHGRPSLVPTVLADKIAGLVITQAVLAALVRKGHHGVGSHIEVAMTEAMAAFMLVEHGGAATAEPPCGEVGYPRILTPRRRPAATRDSWVHVLPYSKQNYVDLFSAAGRPRPEDDTRLRSVRSRVEHADSLYRDVEEILATRTTAEWLDFCRQHGIPASPVVSLQDLIAQQPLAKHPIAGQYHATRAPARFDRSSEVPLHRHAPLQGEHTRDVLGEIGLSATEIEELIDSGAVLAAPLPPRTERQPPTAPVPG
jgi:crotonobetainyl-CoA:carnitine CoA-transferase CaiB-like acyl-CoA transferase